MILQTGIHKKESIDLVQHVIKRFLFDSLDPANKAKIIEHFQWMHRQPENLNFRCRFEVLPPKRTIIQLDLDFIESAPKDIRGPNS